MLNRIAALALAAAALSDAKLMEDQAAAVVAQGAADPSGIDDMERLASDDRESRERAASGRVLDALIQLRSAYPAAFELAAKSDPVPPIPSAPPTDPLPPTDLPPPPPESSVASPREGETAPSDPPGAAPSSGAEAPASSETSPSGETAGG